ncbi:hypothetical protein [Actinocrispum wychmicini]|uniref:Uncharacterized protein n=1 Tax=Actinocrispum wychmicini TaxID=1213861 RepID=A0A4R2JTW7_9PSEU|nr:hypothetical protein [Actinocrispum wychmicini]TCO60738.1 hypothetical protein EV192_103313 [Actinocrispum wychmicini]
MRRELVRFEVRRLLRNPFLWAAAAVALAWQLAESWDWAPDLTVDTVSMTGHALLVAAAVLLVANLAASRDRRHGGFDGMAALPGRAAERTWSVAAAAAVVGAAIAAVPIVGYLVIRVAQGPVAGRLDVLEVLTGIAAVAATAALGVAVGRWFPGLVAGPVVLVLLVLATLMNRNLGGYGGWFLPLVLHNGPGWPERPAGTHLGYLIACVALFGSLALLRHRIRVVRLGVALLAVAVAVPAGAVAMAADPNATARERDARVAEPDAWHCEQRDTVTYCAYPAYASWIPHWAAAVGPVAGAVPPVARDRLPEIRQGDGVWLVWPRGAAEATYRNALAGDVAAQVTGIAAERDARGQARTVVALWLLAQTAGAVPDPAPMSVDIGPYTAVGSDIATRETLLGPGYGPAEADCARRLLATPGAREKVWQNWSTLTNPGTTTEQAMALLG